MGNHYTVSLHKTLEQNNDMLRYLGGVVQDLDSLPSRELHHATYDVMCSKINYLEELNLAITDEIRRLEDPSNPINYLRQRIHSVQHYYGVYNKTAPISLNEHEATAQVEAAAIEILAADLSHMRQSDFDRMCEVAEALAKHGLTRLKTVVESPGVLEQIAANAAARIAEKFV